MVNRCSQLETTRRELAEQLLATPGLDWADLGRLVLTAVAEAEAEGLAAAGIAGSDGVFDGRIWS